MAGIAVLGAGIFAKEAHIPALANLAARAPPLRAVYSRSFASAQDLAEAATSVLQLPSPPAIYHDDDPNKDGNANNNLTALLARKDIDAVIVVLPITVQPAIILRALEAGKHVISEKPVAPDVKEGVELIETYNAIYKPKGLVWRVAENWEVEEAVVEVGKLLKDGVIGDVQSFKVSVVNHIDKSSKWYKTPWRTIPDYQGGFLLDGGVHTIAMLRVILPHPLTHVSGLASLNKSYLLPHDTLQTIVQAGPAIKGTVELTWGHPTPSKPVADSIVVVGSNGWLTINQAQGGWKVVIRAWVKKPKDVASTKGDDDDDEEEKQTEFTRPSRGVQIELEKFFNAVEKVKKGEQPSDDAGNPSGALVDVAFIQAGLTSEGEKVDLAQIIKEKQPAKKVV